MIYKNIDDKNIDIKTLKYLLDKSQDNYQKQLIKTDLLKIKAGYANEQENAYYLNFEFESSKNIIVLHDIRIEHNGQSAQIDHILISRFGVEILESKSFAGVLTINDDNSLDVKYNNKTTTYPNPVEQVLRHKKVLESFLNNANIFPKRINSLGGINIDVKVLINPKTTITNKIIPNNFDRADSYTSKRKKEIDKIGIFKMASLISKMYSIETAKKIAKLISDSHNPKLHKFTKKYKVKDAKVNNKEENNKLETSTTCPRCKNGVLIERTNKNTNAKFLGCSKYPKCKYSQDIQ